LLSVCVAVVAFGAVLLWEARATFKLHEWAGKMDERTKERGEVQEQITSLGRALL